MNFCNPVNIRNLVNIFNLVNIRNLVNCENVNLLCITGCSYHFKLILK